MRSLITFGLLLSVASARSIIQSSAPRPVPALPAEHAVYNIPTVHESTVQARRIMHLSSHGTLVTTFPDEHLTASDEVVALENRPQGVAGNPIGLMEYIADCEPETGNPTLLAINIATPFRNYKAGSNISLAIRWWPEEKNTYSMSSLLGYDTTEIPTPHTAAALPRFSLHGHLERIETSGVEGAKIAACFLKKHPDSIYWQPGSDVHESHYMRLVVEHVYWFGGFGDRARIAWLPIDEWRNVTQEEIETTQLPGEKKSKGWWKEWL